MVGTRGRPAWTEEGRWRLVVLRLLALIAAGWLIGTLPPALAFLLVVGTLFTALVFARPRWGLYLLPFAVPFGSLREVAVGPATVGGTEALLALFIAAWAARGVARRSLRLAAPPLLWPLLLWYGVMWLSLLQAASPAASAKELIKWGESFLLYAIAAQELERRDAAIVVGATLLAMALAATEGIIQSIFRIGPEGFLIPMGGRIWLRAYGRFVQPNPFAGYLGLVLPLGYALVAAGLGFGVEGAGQRRGRLARLLHRGRVTLPAAGATLLGGTALLLTFSRGGWIGAVAALVTTAVLLSRQAALLSVIATALAALGAALGLVERLPPAITDRATDFLPFIRIWDVDVRRLTLTEANFSVVERLAHWQAAIDMWSEKLWFGQGVGNYATVYPRFLIPPWNDPLGHAHNIYLNALAETGLVGLLAYLLFWGAALLLSLRAVRRSRGLWRGVALGITAAMIHLHVHNFFDNLFVHGIYLHLMLLLAVAALLAADRPGAPPATTT